MRKLITLAVALMISSICFAQKDVTKFLGIPVDGAKSAMIQKLKSKGFTYNQRKDCLEGEFNGRDVELHVVTNNNKVYRIVVLDALGSDESSIKIRFNTLCRQFKKNEKYVPTDLIGEYEISEDEDISYEMAVNSKRYEASYYQFNTSDYDSTALREFVLSKLSTEDLEKMTDEEGLEKITNITAEFITDLMSKKTVWFMINKEYGDYYIIMYYDNEYNKANGEDL